VVSEIREKRARLQTLMAQSRTALEDLIQAEEEATLAHSQALLDAPRK
jgi:hypothetical protein